MVRPNSSHRRLGVPGWSAPIRADRRAAQRCERRVGHQPRHRAGRGEADPQPSRHRQDRDHVNVDDHTKQAPTMPTIGSHISTKTPTGGAMGDIPDPDSTAAGEHATERAAELLRRTSDRRATELRARRRRARQSSDRADHAQDEARAAQSRTADMLEDCAERHEQVARMHEFAAKHHIGDAAGHRASADFHRREALQDHAWSERMRRDADPDAE